MSEIERVKDPADPRRCKGQQPDGQCRNISEYGSDYCRACGGRSSREVEERTAYMLKNVRHRERLATLRSQDQVVSLREEIAMCRMMIEMLWNKVDGDENALLAESHKLNELLKTLERLSKTTAQLEFKVGSVLAKPTVIVIAREIINHITSEIAGVPGYEEKIDRIAEKVFDTIERTTNEEEGK